METTDREKEAARLLQEDYQQRFKQTSNSKELWESFSKEFLDDLTNLNPITDEGRSAALQCHNAVERLYLNQQERISIMRDKKLYYEIYREEAPSDPEEVTRKIAEHVEEVGDKLAATRRYKVLFFGNPPEGWTSKEINKAVNKELNRISEPETTQL